MKVINHYPLIPNVKKRDTLAYHSRKIVNLWDQTKRHMRKFNGIKEDHFYWFFKGV